jgi:hypothetical protein
MDAPATRTRAGPTRYSAQCFSRSFGMRHERYPSRLQRVPHQQGEVGMQYRRRRDLVHRPRSRKRICSGISTRPNTRPLFTPSGWQGSLFTQSANERIEDRVVARWNVGDVPVSVEISVSAGRSLSPSRSSLRSPTARRTYHWQVRAWNTPSCEVRPALHLRAGK